MGRVILLLFLFQFCFRYRGREIVKQDKKNHHTLLLVVVVVFWIFIVLMFFVFDNFFQLFFQFFFWFLYSNNQINLKIEEKIHSENNNNIFSIKFNSYNWNISYEKLCVCVSVYSRIAYHLRSSQWVAWKFYLKTNVKSAQTYRANGRTNIEERYKSWTLKHTLKWKKRMNMDS